MGALKISATQVNTSTSTSTTSTINYGQEEIERQGLRKVRAASHTTSDTNHADTSNSVTIKSDGGKFHPMPSSTKTTATTTMTTNGSDSRAQSNMSTISAPTESRTMPLIHPRQQKAAQAGPQQQQQHEHEHEQPHGTTKLLTNLSSASAQQSSCNNHNHHPHHPHYPHLHHHHHSFMKTTTTSSLVYQIVIISLILHELPPLSSSTSTYQTTSGRGLVAASLHSPASSSSNHRQSAVATAAAAAAAGDRVGPRHKRHLAAAADDKQVDCHKLSSMWQYLHTSYPALASHLLEWSSQTATGKQSDERFLWARSSQAARSIGHLLEEAERLTSTASGKRPGGGGGGGGGSGDGAHQRQLAGAAWLARVSANPTYAKLVQHLRAKQMQLRGQHSDGAHQHKHSSSSSSPSSGESSGQVDDADGDGNGSGSGNGNGAAEADGEQMAAAASSTAAGPGATYGRVVHHPREIGSTDNSHGMARTLDKLRLLSHHNRQQQQQQQQPQTGGADRDIEETNRIPLATDVDQMTESDWRRLRESATDAARQNFVYGKVMLRPNQAHPHQQDQPAQDSQQQQQQYRGHNHYQRPLEVLQGVQHEQEQQRLAAASGGHQSAPPSGGQAHDTGFGRIVSGPQLTGGLSGGTDNDDKSTQHRHAATLAEQQQRQQQAQQMDELRVLSSDTDYRAASNGGGGSGSDELANQQRFQTMAVVESRPGESSGGGDADFDELGVFHNAPLEKPEVRILRSAPAQQSTEPVIAKATNGLNFVVD